MCNIGNEYVRDFPKVNVCGLMYVIIIGPLFFVEQTNTGTLFLDVLDIYTLPQIEGVNSIHVKVKVKM